MTAVLLILFVVLSLMTLCSGALCGLFFYAYNHTLDGTAELYRQQLSAVYVMIVVTVILLVLTILCFRAYKKKRGK